MRTSVKDLVTRAEVYTFNILRVVARAWMKPNYFYSKWWL
jgi:hypothetical protein